MRHASLNSIDVAMDGDSTSKDDAKMTLLCAETKPDGVRL
jgi:hypothetical protein